MTHSLLAGLAVLATVATAHADPSELQAYDDYATYVASGRLRVSSLETLAIAASDPDGKRCFARTTTPAQRLVCQSYVQERALVDALPVFAVATRAKRALEQDVTEASRAALVPFGVACADAADRLAATGMNPRRIIAGPYSVGLVKSKLCNALIVSASREL